MNAQAVTVDILDLSDPAAPVKLASIAATAYGASANNVDVANGVVAVAIEALHDGSFWISDEYGPHILHEDAEGRTLERINPLGTGSGGIVQKILPASGEVDRNKMYFVDLTTVGVTERRSSAIPAQFALGQNYPNPFNPSTNLTYALPRAVKVQLAIYDMLGRKVVTLVDKFQQAGIYSIRFDASGLGTGLYFYRLDTDTFAKTRKMLLVR